MASPDMTSSTRRFCSLPAAVSLVAHRRDLAEGGGTHGVHDEQHHASSIARAAWSRIGVRTTRDPRSIAARIRNLRRSSRAGGEFRATHLARRQIVLAIRCVFLQAEFKLVLPRHTTLPSDNPPSGCVTRTVARRQDRRCSV